MNLLILSRSKARCCVLGLLGVVPRLLAGPTVTLDHGSYFPGETITAAFSGGPGNKLDWIGIYPEGVSHDGSIGSTIWRYVNNTQIGSIGLTEGTVSFPVGLQVSGIWDAYFLLNDGYTGLATNQFNVVDPGSPLIRANKGVYGPGESIFQSRLRMVPDIPKIGSVFTRWDRPLGAEPHPSFGATLTGHKLALAPQAMV